MSEVDVDYVGDALEEINNQVIKVLREILESDRETSFDTIITLGYTFISGKRELVEIGVEDERFDKMVVEIEDILFGMMKKRQERR